MSNSYNLRNRAASLMRRFGISPRLLHGKNRSRHSIRHLDTMDTLADPYAYFAKAMNTELEHGTAGSRATVGFPFEHGTDVTQDDELKTAKIVAAHLRGVEHGKRPNNWKFSPAYYDWLWYTEEHALL